MTFHSSYVIGLNIITSVHNYSMQSHTDKSFEKKLSWQKYRNLFLSAIFLLANNISPSTSASPVQAAKAQTAHAVTHSSAFNAQHPCHPDARGGGGGAQEGL